MSTATLNAPISNVTASSDEAAILSVVETLRRSHHNKDAALFAAQFAPDAAIFNLAPPLIHHGIDLKEKQAWLDSWTTPVNIESRDLKITVSGDFAFCHGYLRMSGTKKEPKVRSISGCARRCASSGREAVGRLSTSILLCLFTWTPPCGQPSI